MSTATASDSAASAGSVHSRSSLYVGDLGSEVTEAQLFEVFNAVGPVASVRVCRDAATRRSLGYAYVNFHTSKDAETAMARLNYTDIRGKMCRIMWSHRDPSLRKSNVGNIFIKNLAKSIDHRTLYETFVIFGNILSCKVATNSKGESLGYGFIHFESEDSANSAIAKVDGKTIGGEKVSVSAFKSKRDRGADSKQTFTNLYVKFLPTEFNKEQLEKLFSKYGTVTSCMVSFDEEKKACKGFGFVNMSNPEEAQAAVDALNNFELSGKKLFVGRAQKKEERERELRTRFEKIKQERQAKYQQGANLYIKNLNDDVDDKRLRELFTPFGEISSARIMRDQATGKSKGFGFVSFATPEEATKAVTDMNGKMVEDKPLYVALAQKKEIRRAQLEGRRAGPGGAGMMGGMPPYGAPMYYNRPQNFMYPMGAAAGGRGAGAGAGGPGGAWMMQGQAPQMMMPYGYMMPGYPQAGGRGGFMPGAGAPAGAAGGPVQAGAQRGGGAGRGRGGVARGGAATSPQAVARRAGGAPATTAAGGAVVFDSNVRNPQAAQQAAPAAAPQSSAPEPAIAAGAGARNAPLTIKALAAAPEHQKKQMIGEQLFPRVRASQPQLAGKITGMLLEMDNGELIHLLESQEALAEKISEAVQVLEGYETQKAE